MQREVVVTPKSWSPRGEAALQGQGRQLLIWSGIPGETARVRIVHEGEHQDYAVFRDTRRPDPHRIAPVCDRYHTCGGCPLMHLDEGGQAYARRQMVQAALHDEGLGEVPVGNLVASPDGRQDFRHVLKLGVGFSDMGHLRVGAWGRRTRSVVPIPECPVVTPVLRTVMASVAHHVIELGLQPYDPESDRGVLRAFVLRQSRATGEVLVTIVAGRRVKALSDLASRLVGECSVISGVVLHLHDDEGNAIFSRDEEGHIGTLVLEGRAFVEDRLLDLTYRIGAGDFFQTNPGMAERLYADTLERLELGPQVPFLDLYCGVGGLALPAARLTGWAMGVEEVQGAVTAAREAARANGLSAEFVAGRVGEVLPTLQRRLGPSHPVVAVNPARRGLEPGVAEAIVALQPRRIAYISCNPRALARDLVAFQALGMQVESVQIYDMFPHTAHVECVAILGSPHTEEVAARRAPRRRALGASRSSA